MNILIKKIVKNLLKLLYIFPVQKKKIFFMSFDGTVYGFDSKAMIQYINSNYPKQYELFWGTQCNKLRGYNLSDKVKLVKIKSMKGMYHIITAKTLIYNINPPSYVPFRKQQLLINTWHGFAYKKVGKYGASFDESQFNTSTCFLSHSQIYSQRVIRESFLYRGEILPCGVPRNDLFFKSNCGEIAKNVKMGLSIGHRKIALYAPTFRDGYSYKELGIDFLKLRNVLSKQFGGEWVVLTKLHPMLVSKYRIENENTIDVSLYADMQELLLISDILITDYSSCMWDYSLMKKPVFLLIPDIEEYIKGRGLYDELSELPFVVSKTNKELEENITNFNLNEYQEKVESYLLYMGNYEKGNACATVMQYIRNH